MAQKITFSLHVEYSDGTVRSWEEMTDAEHKEVLDGASKRGSSALSAYYTQHLSEFTKL